MSVLARARDIIINPHVLWHIIKDEQVELKHLILNYAAPLALIPIVSGLIGMTLIGIRMPGGELIRSTFFQSLGEAILHYGLSVLGLYLLAQAVKLLAPYFLSKVDLLAAGKLVVYSLTPVWLIGIFQILPLFGLFVSVLGLYWIYLFYLGLPILLETPGNKQPWFCLASVLAAILIPYLLFLTLYVLFSSIRVLVG